MLKTKWFPFKEQWLCDGVKVDGLCMANKTKHFKYVYSVGRSVCNGG